MKRVIDPCQILFMCQEKTRHLYKEDRVVFLDSFFSKRRKSWEAEAKKSSQNEGLHLVRQLVQGEGHRLPNLNRRKPLNRVDR
jgi:hypothetical protein